MKHIHVSSGSQRPITRRVIHPPGPHPGRPILPGPIRVVAGSARDLEPLARFHYAPSRPATFADVRVAIYDDPLRGPRAIGVGVLSWPVPNVPARLRYFGFDPIRRRENLAFANTHVRTISRVIVHPQFRSAGVASALVRQLIDRCPTRYVETIAQMGAIHPVFLVCGMHWLNEGHDTEKPYFLIDRTSTPVTLTTESAS